MVSAMCKNSIQTPSIVVAAMVASLLCVVTVNGALSPVNNIDKLEPVVRRSPAISETSQDMFGYAAVLHQVQMLDSGDSVTQAAAKSRIIVGAPRGTYPGGLGLRDLGNEGEVETGLVYSCPLEPGECEGVRGDTDSYFSESMLAILNNDASIDNDRSSTFLPPQYVEGRLFDQAPNAILFSALARAFRTFENKTGQLLGATLFSNGETFIACAPRWTFTDGNVGQVQPRGLCYTSDRSLQNFEVLRPCTSANRESVRPVDDAYCLAGKSAVPYNDYFVIGAPGDDGTGRLYASTSAAPTGFSIKGNQTQVNSSGMPDPSIVDQYQGFTTITAYITQSRTMVSLPPDVVTSLPRYDDTTYRGRINVFNPPNFKDINPDVNAQGTQMGEFFGHSMIAIDLDGDEFDDLVVGAPMNTDYDTLSIERGSIYVFFNDGGGRLMNSIQIPGSIPRARFGTSLANLGDINNDGFEDFAVGAPYYAANSGTNTGKVYIYYGSNNSTAFMTRQPYEISADDIVSSVSGLDQLRTFGWTVSGGVDVDNNMYDDTVIGAYENQTVVVLRTLPVATVTVDILPVPEVDLSSNFMVTVRAEFDGLGVPGPIRVPFVLREVRADGAPPRLSIDNNGEGVFELMTRNVVNTTQLTLIPLTNTTSIDPYMLQLELQDIVRPVRMDINGNQTFESLASFPRLVQAGDNTEAVNITDPCRANGVEGCQSDVMLHPPNGAIIVTAGGNIYHSVDLRYQHVDGEDAVGLNLTFSGLQTSIIEAVTIRRRRSPTSVTTCSGISEGGMATCILQPRLQEDEEDTVIVNFTVSQGNLVGNEPSFSVDVSVVSSTSNVNDMDMNLANNDQQIMFDIDANADISVESLSFGGAIFSYTGMPPASPISSAASLGQSVTLSINVRNRGDTTIREGSLNISIPNRIMDSEFTLLYPTRIDGENSLNGIIDCNDGFVDPDTLGLGSPQVSESRRRRSARAALQKGGLKRVTRQDQTPATNGVTVDCSDPNVAPGTCTLIMCAIRDLRPGLFSVSIFTRIDERFFEGKTATYELTAAASVGVNGTFYGDNPDNNANEALVTLQPLPEEVEPEDSSALLHYILWPCIGGILLLVLVAIVLYFVGFFRRKKKPEDDEAEGDFDVNKYQLQGGADGQSPPTTEPKSDEVSKV